MKATTHSPTSVTRRVFLLAAGAVLAVGLTACQSETPPADNGGDSGQAEQTSYSVTDNRGDETTFDATPERVIIEQVPLAATYVMYHGGNADNLIGMSGSVVDVLNGTVLPKIAPEVVEVDTSYYDNGELNIESMLTLEPDVVLYNGGSDSRAELYTNAGLKHVGFSTSGDPTTLYADWLRTLEGVFNEPGKMDDCIAYGQEIIDMVKERTSTLSEDEVKDVLIFFNYDEGTPSVAGADLGQGGNVFGHYWLEAINVNNCAAELSGIQSVNMEQIYAWDPDVIFMPGAGQCSITVDDVMNNTVEGADMAPLTAVQNGEVYSSELGMWSWYTPNPDAPLVVLWLATSTYPELFEDVDLVQETKDYYSQFYNYDLTDEEVEQIYNRQ